MQSSASPNIDITTPAALMFPAAAADQVSTLTVLGALSLVLLTACFWYPSPLLRWVQRKRYQYEVTFALYMMTPTEKFIFNSILFLVVSMVTIAAALYLPSHVSIIARRAYYIVVGDLESPALGQRISQTVIKTAAALNSVTPTAVKEAVETVKEAVVGGANAAGHDL